MNFFSHPQRSLRSRSSEQQSRESNSSESPPLQLDAVYVADPGMENYPPEMIRTFARLDNPANHVPEPTPYGSIGRFFACCCLRGVRRVAVIEPTGNNPP